MGLLVEGEWHDRWYDAKSTNGRFVRQKSRFNNWVTADGGPGPTGTDGFEAEPDRYHLYISYACPWAHRTLILRALKGLEEIVSLSVVNWFMGGHGWTFDKGPGAIPDHINGTRYLYQVYTKADPQYSGRTTIKATRASIRMVSCRSGRISTIGNRTGAAKQITRTSFPSYNTFLTHIFLIHTVLIHTFKIKHERGKHYDGAQLRRLPRPLR